MKKSVIKMSIIAMGIFTMSLTSHMRVMAADTEEQVINKGVFIGKSDVSGMTAEEAEKVVGREVEKSLEDEVMLTVGSSEIKVSAKELGMGWSNKEIVDTAIGLGKSGNIVKRYKDNKDLEHKNKTYEIFYQADKATVKQYLQNKKEDLDCEAVDGKLKRDENGELVVVPGITGVVLNVDKSAKTICGYMETTWKGKGGTIALKADEQKPRGTKEELSQVKDVLGTATTYYGSTYQRNTNVEVGASKINGTLLYPGESFSVTAAVTPFTAENGYELAPSYESGKVVDSYGGGICQVSTTLYNALLKSELEVTERHNHTMIVTYVDPSKDAAIAEGLMDLQFANNTEYPVYIEGNGYGGQLTFTVYGKEYRSADRVVEYVSETIKTTNPSGVKLYAKADANVGYISQIQSSHTGLEARLWKIVTENGETTKTQVNSSSYQAVPVSYEVGTSSSDPNTVAMIQAAIANNDLTAVQNIIATGSSTGETETTQESESSSTANPTPSTPDVTTPETTADTTQDTTAPVVPETPVPEVPESSGENDIIDPPEPDIPSVDI